MTRSGKRRSYRSARRKSFLRRHKMALSATGILLYGCLVVAVASPGSFAPASWLGSEPETADALEDGTSASADERDAARRSLPQLAQTAPTGDPSTLPGPLDPTGSELVTSSLASGDGEEPFFSSSGPVPPADEFDNDGTTSSAPGGSVSGSFGSAGSLYPAGGAAGGPGSLASLSGANAFLPPGTPGGSGSSPTATSPSGGAPSPTGGDGDTGDDPPSHETGPGTSTGGEGTPEPGDDSQNAGGNAGGEDGDGADGGWADNDGSDGGKDEGGDDPLDLTDDDPPPPGTGDGDWDEVDARQPIEVPEPGTLTLLGPALAAVWLARRRKARAA